MVFPYMLIANSTAIKRADGAIIPDDPANVDYQAYQAFLAAGNAPAPAPVLPNPTTISAGAFLSRFTMLEQAAIQAACSASPTLALGLTMGLALGNIDLTGPTTTTWMQALVTAGAITAARSTVILTP
jgi:hypothetical protein